MVRSLAVAVGDREVAADCVQDAFMRAFVRWNRVSRLEDPVGWIRHVAFNLARDVRRRRARGARAQLKLVTDERVRQDAAADVPDLSGATLAAELANLPRRQRESLALRYVQGLTVAEVARALGISEGAAKFHLHQGRERLRPFIERLQGGR
jgi:RNA polymerase sigma-70 factor (ECF subfamily)